MVNKKQKIRQRKISDSKRKRMRRLKYLNEEITSCIGMDESNQDVPYKPLGEVAKKDIILTLPAIYFSIQSYLHKDQLENRRTKKKSRSKMIGTHGVEIASDPETLKKYIIKDRNYSFAIIKKKELARYGGRIDTYSIWTSLLKGLGNDDLSSTLVCLDGAMPQLERVLLSHMALMKGITLPIRNIDYGIGLDERVPIVEDADLCAYLILQNLRQKGDKSPYFTHPNKVWVERIEKEKISKRYWSRVRKSRK